MVKKTRDEVGFVKLIRLIFGFCHQMQTYQHQPQPLTKNLSKFLLRKSQNVNKLNSKTKKAKIVYILAALFDKFKPNTMTGWEGLLCAR